MCHQDSGKKMLREMGLFEERLRGRHLTAVFNYLIRGYREERVIFFSEVNGDERQQTNRNNRNPK